ncbi:protein CHROMATIN REMODELING 25 [Selaginella moellendorffii]|uniref:protein CHROMATIN REMODELING 25 n=1 Tax=Selaginella moellendorffii TaxID=88036 RepID=UPI000D1CCEC2|nr:protein CHROMATIN REMODELING 25 [Selaginella moellendorffii]|eukprot:XP_024532859.1 protein CHROMATIN REMODELING 25 [Selaginella moellendorffii]
MDDEDFQLEDDEEEEEGVEDLATPENRKSENVAALLRGDLVVKRQALIPKVLTVTDGAAVIRRPFKSPCPGGQSNSDELLRRLSARKRFVPWKRQPLLPLSPNVETLPIQEDPSEGSVELPDDFEPLVLWQPDGNEDGATIVVDPIVAKFLRPHQREGVQFMFECVTGLREFSKAGDAAWSGCILADDMGLGKTLQSITLLWTLLRQGFQGSPIAKRIIIVTPTSLVSNWESEIKKWLGGRASVIAICEASRAEVLQDVASFLSPRNAFQILIISYETFRLHAGKFQKEGACDLLICDEAHRLKNDHTLTNQALASLQCHRRVLLSGTPMQNDLEEFYAMVNFTNPGILGEVAAFRRYYQNPILRGREPEATEDARKLGLERSAELSEKVNQFILRRTNALLSNHLPPKIVEVVCCKLTNLQRELYTHFIHSKNVRLALQDKAKRARVLASITALKKLCSHPKLIYDTVRAGGSEAAGFENCMQFFPKEMQTGRGTPSDGSWVKLSGKMFVLARLLENLRKKTNDRIVLVSNYTQTLDLFAQLCRERNYPYVRLDGSTSIGKRQKLVQKFNDPSQNEFAFLLSSKAGGCGLNLIGGNRLVLFDPDWNPANDKQAAARVWRDGQKKRVYIYRFLATGTIEEKVYQRQMSKEGLQKVISGDSKAEVNALSTEDLRDLFTLRDISSDTHDTLDCERCDVENVPNELANQLGDIGAFAKTAGCLERQRHWEKQIGEPAEEDLIRWAHHSHPSTVPDVILQWAAGEEVSFVFTCQIDGKVVPIDSILPSAAAEEERDSTRTARTTLPTFAQKRKLDKSVLQAACLRSPKRVCIDLEVSDSD